MTGQGVRGLLTPLLVLIIAAGLVGCTGGEPADSDGPVVVAPGAPGEPPRVLSEPPPRSDQPYTPADVTFAQAMLAHHAQALRMTDLVPDRTVSADIARFAERIARSQEAEMAQLTDWLEVRGEDGVQGEHGAADHDSADRESADRGDSADRDSADHGAAPGMLSEAQFAELESATGNGFDRRFLELMIIHHEGALVMIEDLRGDGGGQEPHLAELVTHMDADQRIEIDRMSELLGGAAG